MLASSGLQIGQRDLARHFLPAERGEAIIKGYRVVAGRQQPVNGSVGDFVRAVVDLRLMPIDPVFEFRRTRDHHLNVIAGPAESVKTAANPGPDRASGHAEVDVSIRTGRNFKIPIEELLAHWVWDGHRERSRRAWACRFIPGCYHPDQYQDQPEENKRRNTVSAALGGSRLRRRDWCGCN